MSRQEMIKFPLAWYNSLTLVVAFCRGSHISPKKVFFFPIWPCAWFIITPIHLAFVKQIFIDIYKNLQVKIEKLSPIFFEFIGFMVFKTTCLISGLTSFYGFENNALEPKIFAILWFKFLFVLQISPATVHCFQNR